ncbi:MAG: SpoVA/SpoVAEb family sporulation membrane protein [Christensenellaceae bacterium]|nr:SpoVA/SpoVAEb family sporulation membrane protein [Christensenellaceae bacterium]
MMNAHNKEYLKLVASNTPKTKHISTMLSSFIVGGLICCLGQGINDVYMLWLPHLSESTIKSLVSVSLFLIASTLTCIGVYDKISEFGGAGAIIPITGFANSIISPAIEHRREGIIGGLCSNMFIIAGPVLVTGIVISVLIGFFTLVFSGAPLI